MAMKLPKHFYHKVYDILENAGAEPWNRDDFIEYFSKSSNAGEYSCCDKLGHGGKFVNHNGSLYVSYFPEDETDDVYYLAQDINNKLKDLLNEYLTSFNVE